MSKFEIKMPKPGESVTEGTIVSWFVKVGELVNEDDVLFEVNTSKVSAEIPSPVSGKVTEIFFKEGDVVTVGTVVAIIETEAEAGQPETPEENKAAESKEPESKNTVEKPEEEDARWYSPAVLAKAGEAGIRREELDSMPGTGYMGRLTKRDVEILLEQKQGKSVPQPATAEVKKETKEAAKTVPPAGTGYKDAEAIPMDAVRRIIADRMVASKATSAHVTNVLEADVTRLVKWREQHKAEFFKREGVKLTYMPMFIEAVTVALQQFPRINSSVEGHSIIQKKQINIGVAVSLDNGNLIVPVVKNADKLSISGLASAVASLAVKARGNKLTMDDIQGGTFTITNFGSFNNLFGTPIINQPEVAILGVGIIEKKPSVLETPEGDVIAIRHKMYLSLSYDHRIIDGALGGSFLKSVADYLENWK